MAIRFTDDKPASKDPGRRPAPAAASDETAGAQGAARFATPIEAVTPVNPDAAGELPFADLPPAEKAERKKRSPKPVSRK